MSVESTMKHRKAAYVEVALSRNRFSNAQFGFENYASTFQKQKTLQ